MIVVKLGGSLYDHPALRAGLNRWLETVPTPILLVPGGGAFADAVRAFDRLHGIGEWAAHRASIRSMGVAAETLMSIISIGGVHVLDADLYCREHDQLPHSWDVTSDSIALRMAMLKSAEKLILLKSLDRPEGTWESLAENDFVDRHFPILAKSTDVPIEVVNFRRHLDGYMNVEST